MKKSIFFIFLSVAVISLAAVIILNKDKVKYEQNNDYLRIHIRANSNSQTDQAVKYKVKEKIVEYLTPIIASSQNQNTAKATITEHLDDITEIANSTLKKNNFFYTANAKIKTELFPARTYAGITLEAGTYEALIIDLGSGSGDNWWCVMFPPLCFVDASNTNSQTIKYKSKLYELINNFFGKK